MMPLAIPVPLQRARALVTAAAGLTLGIAYTLSPLTVLAVAVMTAAAIAASRGLSRDERRWFWCVVSVAVLLRLLAIALLFLTADPSRPFASFFGDEELYKFRSVWLRNVGQGIPISPADVIYSFDAVGNTGYMDVLAFVQALVGDAPYGLHLFNLMLCLCGILAIYRLARAAYGPTVSMAGLIALLYLPSMALWSISVLKEPMNVFMLAGELICAVYIVRARRWWQKALASGGVVVFALSMDSLRGGGILTAAVGVVGGLSLSWLLARGRRVMTAIAVAPIAIAALAATPAVQERAMASVRRVAFYHAGHVLTPGYSYQLVNPHYYANRVELLNHMPPVDAGQFVVKALWSYVVEPLPWKTKSRTLQAYMPEQLLWYLMVLLLPFGLLAGLRRDRLLTSILAAHAAAAVVLVALTGGNLGTLIRHRSLALPYLVWLSALGAQECVRLYARRHCAGVEKEPS